MRGGKDEGWRRNLESEERRHEIGKERRKCERLELGQAWVYGNPVLVAAGRRPVDIFSEHLFLTPPEARLLMELIILGRARLQAQIRWTDTH